VVGIFVTTVDASTVIVALHNCGADFASFPPAGKKEDWATPRTGESCLFGDFAFSYAIVLGIYFKSDIQK